MTAYRTKGTVSEDDVYALVQRYGAATVFTLLQEISQSAEKDLTIDWRTLVKATSTGITNAREYQMLWRHLAYREPLEKNDNGDEPLSDESDLEFELEATSTPGKEASTELDYYVKVLLSSGLVGDSAPTVASCAEAPSTSDMPNDLALVIPSDKHQLTRSNRAANGTASLHAQKQPLLAGPSNEALDGNGSSNSGFPPKKKRKLWSKEEDMELIAAVEKFGEGNWANILKGEFKHDRTASQLSQRWAIIRKRQANSNQSTVNKSRSEEMLAAQKAFSMALNMPMSGSLSTILSGGTQMQTTSSSTCGTAGALDASQTNASQSLKQNQQPSSQEMTTPRGVPNPSSKPRATQKKPPAQMKATICPNPSIKAAAFAAGGRIATPSTAASLLKAAQSKNAVRIRHGGSASLPRSSVTSIISSPSAAAATSTTTATTSTAIPGSHALRFIHPSTISQVSSGGSLITSKLGQVQGNLGNATSLSPSASMQMLSSELKPAILASCSSHENAERRQGIIISAVDVDELLAEEVRDAQEKEESDVLVQNTENGISAAGSVQTDISSSQGGDSNPIIPETSAPVPVTEQNESHGIEDAAVPFQNLMEEQSSEAIGSNEVMKQISDAANSDDRGCKDACDSKQDNTVSLKADGSPGYKVVS